jgi:hypothetical protein
MTLSYGNLMLLNAAAQLTLYHCSFLHSQKQTKGRSTKRSLRVKGMSMPSSAAASSLPRALQATGAVSAGGGGSATLFYAAKVNSETGMTATAMQAGTGEVMGMGFGSIVGPDGMASAGGRGGGNITGGFNLYAFNGGFGNAIGGGQVGGFGGGSGQFVPGMNAQIINAMDAPAESTGMCGGAGAPTPFMFFGATGGGGGAIAFAQGLGAANITSDGVGEFAAANATGITTSFGIGYGQGSNSDGLAGGNAVSFANAEGGGAGEAGGAPTAGGVASTVEGGLVQFFGGSTSLATNVGGGYFGAMPKIPTPYFPPFVVPDSPAGLTFPNP